MISYELLRLMFSMFMHFIFMLIFSYYHIPLPLFRFDKLTTDHTKDKTNRSVYCIGKIKTIFGRGVESSPAHTEELVTTTLYRDLPFHGSVHAPLGPVSLSALQRALRSVD